MSMICFPFKKENVPTVLRNVHIAASHKSVSIVVLAAASKNICYCEVLAAINATNLSDTPFCVPVVVIVQDRLGELRPGKGDGMNSAMRYFLTAHEDLHNALPAPLQRLHFYDADIESFDALWISKAEAGAALGYDVVRHYFPRSSTDAQVTWQVTKVGFALLWPRTTLPWVQQPLGGELCLSRKVVETLMDDPRVVRQSDWGIDTLYSFVCAQNGFSLLEAYVPQGKMHALYNGLRDLQNMLCECFSAVQSLKDEHVETAPTVHRIDPSAAVLAAIQQKIGYDVEKSLKLLRENWTDRQVALLDLFGDEIKKGMLAAREWPEYMFMTEDAWVRAYKVFLDNFALLDEDWREVLFKVWVARVLNYTMRHVLRGYHPALQANTDMVMKLHMERSMEMFNEDQMSELKLNGTAPKQLPDSPKGRWQIDVGHPISPVPSEDGEKPPAYR